MFSTRSTQGKSFAFVRLLIHMFPMCYKLDGDRKAPSLKFLFDPLVLVVQLLQTMYDFDSANKTVRVLGKLGYCDLFVIFCIPHLPEVTTSRQNQDAVGLE